MGFFDFLRKSDERAMPEPGTPEFEAMVQGSAIPDQQSVSMGESGWTQPGSSQTVDLRGTGKREEIQQVLREHGMALFRGVPNSGGIGDGIPAPKSPTDQDAG